MTRLRAEPFNGGMVEEEAPTRSGGSSSSDTEAAAVAAVARAAIGRSRRGICMTTSEQIWGRS